MPRYKVRDGAVIAHGGSVLEAGALLELQHGVANDVAVRGLIDQVDEQGNIVAATEPDDLERFRSHERVSILRDQIVKAQAFVDQLQARLDAEDKILADAVRASAKQARAATKSTDAPADSKAKE